MFSIKYRVPIIGVLLLLTLFFGIGLKKMTKESGIEALIPTTNKDYLFFKEMEKEFGNTDQIVIGFTFKDSVYKSENLQVIQDFTHFITSQEIFEEDDITSLSTIDNIQGIDEELIIKPLIPEDEEINSTIAKNVETKVDTNDMLRGKITSSDKKSSVVIITVSSEISMNAELLDSAMKIITSEIDRLESRNIVINRSGMVSVKHITSHYMSRDMSIMFPLAIITVIIILAILLKSLTGIIMPMLVTIFSIVWTLGLKGWLGSPLTITETTIPVMLIAIGCADGVHIITEFLHFRRDGVRNREAIKLTLKNLRVPVILTSITTSLGFFSLIVAPGVSIKNMGLFLGFGVMTAMVFSLLFIPACLSFNKDKEIKTKKEKKQLDLTPIANFIIKRKIAIILFSIVILGISIIGMSNIVVETDQIEFLKDKDPLKLATKELQKNLGGVNTLDIVFEGDEDSFKKPEHLLMIEELESFVKDLDIVGYTISLNDYIKKINFEFNSQNSQFNTIPQSQDIISNLLFLYEMGGGENVEKVVNFDYSRTKLSIRLKETKQEDIENLINILDNWLEKNINQGITYRYSNDYIRIVMGNLITSSQIKSFVSTLIAIIFLLMIIFRSPLSGFLTSLPVIIAVSFNFGIMWLTGTTLNVGSSIIASVGMGVGIDYAIHFFQRYKEIYKESGSNNLAITQAINESYRPIMTNALAVGLGFLTLLFSNYFVITEIGWITGISMLTTALCALFILPAYLALFEPLKKRKGDITMKKGLIALLILIAPVIYSDEKGDEIMLQNYKLPEASTVSNLTTMVLINKQGKKKSRQMESYTITKGETEDRYIEFTLPADVKGTKFLTIGNSSGDDDQRIYLPALKKVRKISSSNKKGKFMGSDITYYDMESKTYNQYTYKYIKEISDNNREYWVVESTPVNSDSPYGKTMNYVSKNDNFIYKREMYDKKGKHIKTMTIVEVKTIDGIIIPVKSVMENHKENHKTLLALDNITINSEIDMSKFTIQNLK